MNRRTFLQSLAAAAAAPAFAQASAKPSLGFTLYGMKTLPLDVALKTCAEVGFQHVEFALNPGYVTEPKVFNAEARKAAAAKLTELEADPYGLKTTALVSQPDRRRLRVGDYRVVYTIEAEQLVIWVVHVGHRSRVYDA